MGVKRDSRNDQQGTKAPGGGYEGRKVKIPRLTHSAVRPVSGPLACSMSPLDFSHINVLNKYAGLRTRALTTTTLCSSNLNPMFLCIREPLLKVPHSVVIDCTLTFNEVRQKATERLGIKPCIWQTDVCCALCASTARIVLSTAATGAGKTSTFWIPILFESAGITILIVPLKDLGAQMSSVANGYGLSALDVTRETLDDKDTFNVCQLLHLGTG